MQARFRIFLHHKKKNIKYYAKKKEEEEKMNELGKEALEELNDGKGDDTPEEVKK